MSVMEEQELALSKALIALFKGVIFRERQPELWQTVLEQRAQISDYTARLGLVLLVDEVDEYAFLRQREQEELPRLVPRYPLSYGLSLLLVSLRKSLGEYDASHGDMRLVLTISDMGRQSIPGRVVLRKAGMALRILGLEDKADWFRKAYGRVLEELPQLREWFFARQRLIYAQQFYPGLLAIGRYLLAHPGERYLREYDIPGIDTKFLEHHGQYGAHRGALQCGIRF